MQLRQRTEKQHFDPNKLDELFGILLHSRKNATEFNFPDLGIAAEKEQQSRSLNGDQIASEQLARINHYDLPALIVDRRGKVLISNVLADGLANIRWGVNVDDIGFKCQDSMLISELVTSSFSAAPKHQSLHAVSAFLPNLDESITLAILIPEGKEDYAIIFVLRTVWSKELANYLISQFDLTASEVNVVEAFSKGQSLQEIAIKRKRSLATVRKQFYLVLEKCDVNSQAELLLMLFHSAKLIQSTSKALSQIKHPHRREFLAPRPAGRSVQFTLAGDVNGDLVVLLTSDGVCVYPPSYEGRFLELGMQVLSLSRPGVGGTSVEPLGQDYHECAHSDFLAVLDQLEVEKAVIYAPAMSFREGVEFALKSPGRIHHVISTTPVLPSDVTRQSTRNDQFMDRVKAVADKSPAMLRFASRAIYRTYSLIGHHQFLKIVFRHDNEAFAVLEKNKMIPQIDHGLKIMFAQGIDFYCQDMLRSAENWDDKIRECLVPITFYGAASGGMGIPSVLKSFVSKHTENIRYLEVDVASGCLVHACAEDFMQTLKSCFEPLDRSELGQVTKVRPIPTSWI